MEFTTRTNSVEEDEDQFQPCTRPRSEAPTLSQVVGHNPSGDRSPTNAEAPYYEQGSIQHIVEDTSTQHVQRELDKSLTFLHNDDPSTSQPSQEEQLSTPGNGLSALESSTRPRLHSIQEMLEDIQHYLDII